MIVIVVEPDLSPGNDLGSFRELFHTIERRLNGQFGLVRMDPDGCVDKRILFGQYDPAIEIHRPIAIPDGHESLNPNLARPRDDLLTIRIEALSLEMCVGIYKHSRQSLAV